MILQPIHILFHDFEQKIQNKTPRTMILKKTRKKIKTKNKTPRTMFLKKTGKKIKTIRDKDEKLHVVWGSRKRQRYISTLSKAFESDCKVTAVSMSAWCSQTVGNSYLVHEHCSGLSQRVGIMVDPTCNYNITFFLIKTYFLLLIIE